MDKTCFIFLYKENPKNSYRFDNLITSLKWIKKYFPECYQKIDILIVEQDISPNMRKSVDQFPSYLSGFNIRHEFIFNPKHFNRGWAFNVAVKHFTDKKIVVLADNDILIKPSIKNIIQSIDDNVYDVASPYNAVYFSKKEERAIITQTLDYDFIEDIKDRVAPSFTLFGGVTVIKRSVYLELGGFEEYNGYGYEDRAFDVVAERLLDKGRIYCNPEINVHLYHPKSYFSLNVQKRMRLIKAHLFDNYGCKPHMVKKGEYLHKHCKHTDKDKIMEMVENRKKNMGDKDYYANNPEEDKITLSG